MTSWRTADDLFIEACWREILEAFGFVVPPRDPIQVAFTSRASFLASRAQLLRHPKAHYEKALKLIGSARCHEGPLDFDKLFLFEKRCKDLVGPDADVKSPACDPIRREWQARALDPARVEADLNKLPGAMAFEHLIHIVIGGEPFKTVPEQPCEKLLHRSLCAWSPCV